MCIVPAARVKKHLESFGLLSKEPKRWKDGAQVLGQQVWGGDHTLYWRRGNKIPDMPRVVTQHNIFSLRGKLVGHLPMGGWFCVAGAFKWRASEVTDCHDKVEDAPLNTMIEKVLNRVHKENLECGKWLINGRDFIVWVNTSSLATSVLLEYDWTMVEDACWLWPEKDSQHINLIELDAIRKGVNLAIL